MGVQVQRTERTELRVCCVHASVVEMDQSGLERLSDCFSGYRGVTDNNFLFADHFRVNFLGACPKHCFLVAERITRLEIQPGMNNNIIIEFQVERKSIEESAIEEGQFARVIDVKACQGFSASV